MKIVFATSNPHKLHELNEICADSGIEFVLPSEGFAPIENGSTFEENSLIKAKEAFRVSKTYSLADDSGLCVDALDGAPGLYSARYAGTQDEKIEKLLGKLKGFENRRAKFVCCVTLLDDKGKMIFQTVGECHGSIVKERKGINGFGYDPIFKADNYDCTIAELSEEEKNKISHRGKALKNFLEFMHKNFNIT